MRFWDTSALVPLFVAQVASKKMRSWLDDDGDVVAWALTDVELRSAFMRLAREGRLTAKHAHEAGRRADEFHAHIHVVALEAGVKLRAKRLLGLHPLRTGDALRLAAALFACSDKPDGLELVTLDERLADAARREGFVARP